METTAVPADNGKNSLSMYAKRSKYSYIYQFLMDELYPKDLVEMCPNYIESKAEYFYEYIKETSDFDSAVNNIIISSAKYNKLFDITASAIIDVFIIPNSLNSPSMDIIDECISKLSGKGFAAFYDDYLVINKFTNIMKTEICEEINSIPPSKLLPNGGINYQKAFKRNAHKFL